MSPSPAKIALGFVLGVAVLAAGFYVVGGDSDESGTTISDGLAAVGVQDVECPKSTSTPPAEPAGVTVVLLDRTASTRGSAAAPDYAAAVEAEVQKAVERGDAVVISGFDGTAATVQWFTVHTTFRGDVNRQQLARAAALECLRQELHDVADGVAEEPNTDVLGAMRAARILLDVAPPGQRRLLVATDGIENTGCADLNTVSVGGDVQPVVERCRTEIPELPGTAVTMLGLGAPGSEQPRPDSTQLEWLDTLWSTLCSETTAADCQVVTGVSARADAPAPAGSAIDQQIRWPEITSMSGGGVVTVTLPDGLLFDTDSSTLRADARGALSEVEKRVREVSGTIVEIVGHTDGRGDPERNDLLSLGRAQQVADALSRDYGLPVEAVRGAGERELKCTPETRPDSSEDTAALQCNRRVKVVIRLSGEQG